jgi:hypothetical protein
MLLKCDKCGWVNPKEFQTSDVVKYRNEKCRVCGYPLLCESDIGKALILADLEEKGLMLPVPPDSERAMILVRPDGIKSNEKSTEPQNRRISASRRSTTILQ